MSEEEQIGDLLFEFFGVGAGRGLHVDLGDAQVAGWGVEEAEAIGETGEGYEDLIVGVGGSAKFL